MKKWMGIVMGCLLVGACYLQFNWRASVLPGKGPHLQQYLPQQIKGWEGRESKLGSTEAAEGKIEGILVFDDVYFREFTSGKGVLSLYAAYWSPGKVPVQVVSSHTPDRCWTRAGWSCLELRHAVELSGLKPGEWRIFDAPSHGSLNVIFWQLVGDELYDFGDRFTQIPHPLKWWRDVARQIVSSPQEQYFIRLTSSVPFDEIWEDEGLQEVVAALAELGLAAERPGNG